MSFFRRSPNFKMLDARRIVDEVWRKHLVIIYYRGRMEARNRYPLRKYSNRDQMAAYLQGREDYEKHGML